MIYTILVYLALIVGVFLTLLIIYFNWVYNYWKKLGVPHRQPIIPYGNIKAALQQEKTQSQVIDEIYKEYKAKGHIHAGYYFIHRPMYLPIDPDLIKHILQVDFHHFVDRGVYYNEKDDPLGAHLFSIEGQKWKNLRTKLTPTFTSGKMKMMFPIMVDISEKLVKTVQKFETTEKVEIKPLAVRFTTDIIGNCAFGIDCNSLDDSNTEFCIQGKKVFIFDTIDYLKAFVFFLFPNFARTLGIGIVPKSTAKFFIQVIKDNIDHRESNNIRRNDFFQLLLDMKNEVEDSRKITFLEFAAQAFLFFVAGYETSSSALSFAMYELARNERVQEKLRQEIKTVEAKYGGKLTYEGLVEMHYMDLVVKETLRMYAPLPFLNRECTEEYQVPNSKVVLEKGTTVVIPIESIHYDPEFYPNPKEFDPERFNEENIKNRPHFAYLPFGEGPRNCIGMRFGLMQTKIGLAALIKSYRVTVNPDTQPIRMDPKQFFTVPADPVWLDFEKI